jgi:hypothetical protein
MMTSANAAQSVRSSAPDQFCWASFTSAITRDRNESFPVRLISIVNALLLFIAPPMAVAPTDGTMGVDSLMRSDSFPP